jgi:hypothetical protein
MIDAMVPSFRQLLPGQFAPLDGEAVERDGCLYGFRKLSDLVRKTNSFDIEQQPGSHLRIRVKQPTSKK